MAEIDRQDLIGFTRWLSKVLTNDEEEVDFRSSAKAPMIRYKIREEVYIRCSSFARRCRRSMSHSIGEARVPFIKHAMCPNKQQMSDHNLSALDGRG